MPTFSFKDKAIANGENRFLFPAGSEINGVTVGGTSAGVTYSYDESRDILTILTPTITRNAIIEVSADLPVQATLVSGGSGEEPAVAPTITGVPTVTGTPQVGNVLTAFPATRSGNPTPTRTWAWIRGTDTVISGATASTYTVVEADIGSTLRPRQIETNSEGSDTADAVPTAEATAIPTDPVYDPDATLAFEGTNDARRLLDQATMGQEFGEAETVAGAGTVEDWIDAQMALPSPTVGTAGVALGGNPGSGQGVAWNLMNSWGTSDAQLRLRVAHALTQIIVVGWTGGSNAYMAAWHQHFIDHAFDNYRVLLGLAVTQKQMGVFLDNEGNSAYDGTPPSQNFGREFLQLFTMGTKKLNRDGTPVTVGGNIVPAYTQADVVAISSYFCGWKMPFATAVGIDGELQTAPESGYTGSNQIHYDGAPLELLGKTEVDYPAFEQKTTITDAEVRARAAACIEVVMGEQTTGVYICKQLIQKLVTDSPSPEYISRVYAAWEDNGAGEVGNIGAVVKAILMDAEARGNTKDITFGRVQEPVLSIMKRLRYGGHIPTATANTATIRVWFTNNTPSAHISLNMGQAGTDRLSVFNDYPFEYSVGGVEAPAAALWSASTLLTNVSSAMSGSQLFGGPTDQVEGEQYGRWYSTAQIAFYDAVVAATSGTTEEKRAAAHLALADRVYADLNQGAVMTTDERTEVVGLLDDLHAAGGTATREKCAYLYNFIMAMPRAAIVV